MKSKILALGLVALASTASAAGLLGTTKSFSTSAFCKTYKCEWDGEVSMFHETASWDYATKTGNEVTIMRDGKNPPGKMTGASLLIPSASASNISADNKEFAELQRSVLGYKAVDLSRECYNGGKKLKSFKHEGRNVEISCIEALGRMSVLISL